MCFGTIDRWHLTRREIPKACSREHCLSINKCWRKSFDQFSDLKFQDYRTDYGHDWSKKE
jgi:hypothetical protein